MLIKAKESRKKRVKKKQGINAANSKFLKMIDFNLTKSIITLKMNG